MELFRLFGSIGLNTDEAEQGLDKVDSKGKSTESRFSRAAKGIAKGGAVVGGALAAAGAAGLAMGNKFANTADEIDKSSMKMGVSTDALQELRFAMGQVGVGQGTLDKALQRTNQRLGEAARGNEKYQDALVGLGFDLEEVKNGQLDVDDVFMQSIDTLNGMENSQEAAALASELFGQKTAQELMPAIEAGTLTIDELRDSAHDLGGVIDEDGVAAGVLWADTMDQLQTMLHGVFNELAQQLLPAFQGFLDWVMDHMPQIQATMQTVFDVISTVIGTVIEWIGKLISWLHEWFEENEETIEAIKEGFMDFVDTVTELFSAFVDLLTRLWDEYGERIIEIGKNLWDTVSSIFQGAFQLIQDIFDVFAALFRGDWQGLWEAVKNLFSNLMDNVITIFENLWDTLVSIAGLLKDRLSNIFTALREAVRNIIQGLRDRVVEIFQNLRDGIQERVQMIFDGVRDKFQEMRDTAEGIFNGFRDTIVGIWDGIWGGIKAVINKIIGGINKMVSGINSIGFSTPDWLPGSLGGREFSPNISKIPMLAKGARNFEGNTAIVGEEGPELVTGLRGSNVYSNPETKSMLGGGGSVNIERGAFEGAIILDDYGVDRLMDRVVDRLQMKGVTSN